MAYFRTSYSVVVYDHKDSVTRRILPANSICEVAGANSTEYVVKDLCTRRLYDVPRGIFTREFVRM
jgi:hypothetical protein